MAEHARIGPSSLDRVSLCPGSVKATAHIPRSSGRAAAEGTLLHGIAEECLTLGMEPWDYLGRIVTVDGHEFTLGEESDDTDPQCMVEALDWLREQPGEFFVEQRVELDPWLPGQFGTLDVGIYTPSLLTVFDWKFGWIVVQLMGNKQIRAYMIGFVRLLKARGYKIPNRIRLMIEQPRPPGAPRFWAPWEITLDELMAFTEELQDIWEAANDPDAKRKAGIKQCFYCQAKDEPGGCYAHSAFMLDLASQKFEDLDDPKAEMELPPEGVITPERRSFIIRHKNMIKGWLDDLSEQALQDGLTDRPTPGLKVIDGDLGNRIWADPVAAEATLVALLADQAFTKKLISPPQSAKLYEPKSKNKPGDPEVWALLTPLIDRPLGKPILVPVEDPRPARIAVDTKFEEETEE